MPYIPPPEYTQMPNAILDNIGKMGNAELKIVLAVCRKTFGWQKREDRISITQLEALTGLSRQGVIDGIEVALEKGWIRREQSGQSWVYSVNVLDQSENSGSQAGRPEPVKQLDQFGAKVVKQVDTQKKDLKKDKEINLQPPAAPALPPSENPPEPKPKRARSPKQLEQDAEVKAVCEAFSETSGIPLPPKLFTAPSKRDVNDWLAPAKSLIGAYNGRSVQAITAAVTKHKAQRKNGEPLAIKNFYSVKWALPPLIEQPKQPAKVDLFGTPGYTTNG